ncbi:AAA family ATPase [Polaribacter haliotis]|uniref:AAA family ATPase n=1 Tax=Polaribacter haliotis TaxID=1888915 RepID=A0A7L8AFN3_9FLAO|nr:AAA family ATPase [Polaribacter haliotis]QOD60629.1 AAA family ATPase [Polaribacter haliotis]
MFNLEEKPKEPIVSDDFLKDILSKRIKSTDTIKQNEFIMKIGNTNKFSKGDISGWIGLAKSKKTFALTMFVSALVGCLRLFDVFNANKECKVLYVDTEQSPADVQRVTKRIQKMSGAEDNLFMYGLRPYSAKERVEAIVLLLKEHKDIDVLIIDGVRDLVMSVNNDVECTEVINLLMKWSFEYEIHIATVLHQNKGDGNARGHLGTELYNKSQSIIRITKDENDSSVSTVEEVIGRGKGFEKFSFRVNDNGLPEVCELALNSINVDKAPWE